MSLIKRKGNECVENLHGKWVGSSAVGRSGNLGGRGTLKLKGSQTKRPFEIKGFVPGSALIGGGTPFSFPWL